MKIKFGITGKLFILYLTFFLIFYGTIIVCFFNINQILRLSETIVLKNNKITLSAKKMIEQLLNMEENTKKYQVLNKIEYWEYYQTARQEFEDNLNKIVELEKNGNCAIRQMEGSVYQLSELFQRTQPCAGGCCGN